MTCRTLSVARSWFYYRRQPRQPRPLRRPQLTPAIQQVLAQCPPSYGYRRIHALLARQGILGGTPVFKGTRVPVKTLFEYLENNYTLDEFLECFPSVTRELARRVLESSESALLTPVAA